MDTPKISPNGKYFSYVTLDPDSRVYNVWLRTLGKHDDRVITQEKKRPVWKYYWQADSEHILYFHDRDGDENYHLYQVETRTTNTRDLTPFLGVHAMPISFNPDNIPDEILVALNLEDRRRHDVYRLNLQTGAVRLDTKNPGDVARWTADHPRQVRAATVITPDGGTEVRVRANPKAPWHSFQKWGPDESESWVEAFTPNNKGLWVVSSAGANASRLMEFDLASGKGKVIAGDPTYDVYTVQTHPTRFTLEAVAIERERLDWQLLDERLEEDYHILRAAHEGIFRVMNRDLADTKWVLDNDTDDRPTCYYLYDRVSRKPELLFYESSPDLLKYTFSHCQPISFTARDGLTLHGYLTLPVGLAPRNLPMVLLVSATFESRDGWGFDYDTQWLANRGYAVLQINGRGSPGYGKSFRQAGDREWGAKMNDDLIDGKRWAVAEGYADPKRVGIMGHSYGGYAALAALAFTPDEFACGIDESGPANLVTLLQTTPDSWAPTLADLKKRIGDWEKDPGFLKARSPVHFTERIRAPLLVVQGANDPRVKQAQADEIVQALRNHGKPVQYLLFPDEGHGIARPDNEMKCRAAEEAFLARHLSGRCEPTSEKDGWEGLTK